MNQMSSSPSTEPLAAPGAPDQQAVRASQRKLLLILACFAIPLLLAIIWLQVLRVQGSTYGDTSRGELVVPARPFEAFSVTTSAGEAWGLDELRGAWTLMYLADGECADACQQSLYHMRQVRLALNHRMDRVRRTVLPAVDTPMDASLVAEHPGLLVLNANAAEHAAFTAQVRAAEAAMHAAAGGEGEAPEFVGIYLVDPNGNLMMRFSEDLDPRYMLKDLKHLLKVSRIG
jgi:cytochrome oxidase Cu insertion factor (SCO1/SenC/PrrC family)